MIMGGNWRSQTAGVSPPDYSRVTIRGVGVPRARDTSCTRRNARSIPYETGCNNPVDSSGSMPEEDAAAGWNAFNIPVRRITYLGGLKAEYDSASGPSCLCGGN